MCFFPSLDVNGDLRIKELEHRLKAVEKEKQEIVQRYESQIEADKAERFRRAILTVFVSHF